MKDNCIVIIEDTSKVGKGGGQVVSQTILKNIRMESYIYDLGGNECEIFQPENKQLLISKKKGFKLLSVISYISKLSTDKKLIIYLATKKGLLLASVIKLLPIKDLTIYYHSHNISRYTIIDKLSIFIAHKICKGIFYPSIFLKNRMNTKNDISFVVGNPVGKFKSKKLDYAPLSVGFIGRFDHNKGFDRYQLLVNKLSHINDIEFFAFSSSRPEDMLDVNNIEIHYGKKTDEIFKKLNVLVSLSRDEETFSLVCAEALNSGAVVFALNVGAIKEVCSSHSSAFIYDDIDSLINGLEYFATSKSFQSQNKGGLSQLVKSPEEYVMEIEKIINI